MIKKNPSGSERLGLRHWLKVTFLLLVTAGLTYYGKFYQPKQSASRNHGLISWIVPTTAGLSSLIICGDDGINSNRVQNGLRIWIAPPKNPRDLEEANHVFYRGTALVSIGDSLELGSIAAMASMIDTGGKLLILGNQYHSETRINQLSGHLQMTSVVPNAQPWNWLNDLAGTDIKSSLHFGNSTGEAVLTLEWNGFRARWWGTVAQAMADSLEEPLSFGVISECISSGQEIPHAKDPKLLTLIYCGTPRASLDSSRIAIQGANSGAVLVEDRTDTTISAKQIHLEWNPLAE
jgi:hypothetical protein